MKIIRALKIFLPVLLVAFVFTNCDMKDSSVGTFDDVADKLPNFTVMEGAEQVTVRVRRNNDRSYFDVNLSNLGKGATILDGDFLGWCAHWSAPIDTRGEAYDNITLYSTRNDKNWNKLNYLLNNRSRFYNEIDGAGYKEIQAVIWTLIEFKEFDIDRNRIFDDLNRAAFDAILDDVREHGDSFEHTRFTTHAVFADMSEYVNDGGDATQTVIIEETAWAWIGPHGEIPEDGVSSSFKYLDLGNQWGWVIYFDSEYVNTLDPSKLVGGMYAGCGFGNEENPEPSDLDNCPQAGDVEIWIDNDNGTMYINVEMIDDWEMTEVQAYVGEDLPEKLAPGSFPYSEENPDPFEHEFGINLDTDFDSSEGPFYILVHAVVQLEVPNL